MAMTTEMALPAQPVLPSAAAGTDRVDVDEVIRTVVRMLVARDQITYEQLAAGTGIPRSTLFRRLGRGPGASVFSASEIAMLARFFGVPVAEIYEPTGALFRGVRNGSFTIPAQRSAA